MKINVERLQQIQQKAMNSVEEDIKHYETLAKYTKHSKKLQNHLWHIRLYKDILRDMKEEYGIE